MKKLTLEIITPQKHSVYADIEYITLPSMQGECGILPNHAPTVIALAGGVLQYKHAHTIEQCIIKEGFATVTGKGVRVLTEGMQ